jgi:CBS domain containing-hemolysin-like protein
MELLIIYFTLAIVVSFLCSILEAVLLTVNMSYISVLEGEHPVAGRLLRSQKENINQSVSSILILNTIAHTVGAAGVGAQAELIFGSSVVFYVSAILTLAILFLSEIIPKTIGASYWKELSPMTAFSIRFLIWLTYPLIIVIQQVTGWISRDREGHNLTKEELLASAQRSEFEGVIDRKESDVIENVLQLDAIRVKDILTPRSVVFAIEESRSVSDIISSEPDIFKFSRVPVYRESRENITGIALTKKIFQQALKDDSVPISTVRKDIYQINEHLPVSRALDLFVKKKEHMFLVVDNYDQVDGIVTLEDCIETLLGIEIMDESDDVEDMRELAKQKMKMKRKQDSITVDGNEDARSDT